MDFLRVAKLGVLQWEQGPGRLNVIPSVFLSERGRQEIDRQSLREI